MARKRITKKRRNRFKLFYLSSLFLLLILVFIFTRFIYNTSLGFSLIFLVLFVALIIHIKSKKYKILIDFTYYGFLFLILFLLSFSGYAIYDTYLKYYDIKKKLGINHLVFHDD